MTLSYTRQFVPGSYEYDPTASLGDSFIYRSPEPLQFIRDGASKTFVDGDAMRQDEILILSEYYWPRISVIRENKETPLTGPVRH